MSEAKALQSERNTPADADKDNPHLALPTRIVSYAWGQTYLDELLSLTLPALLAPGNLPYVAARVSVEMVILTEERFFAYVNAHPTAAKLRQHCPLRLVGLDDLIAASKDGYGLALSYVLHRSFCDLGATMTDAWQMFLNADFILADGSLKTVLGHLQRGERIVAAPSYCVVANDVKPVLHEWVEAAGGILSVTPREMARLALRHRHNTIRGKTINQSEFHIYYMDQFYWGFDESTLLGRQLPIAIVGMRPERHLPEPIAFWDHGLIEEFCPTAPVRVIGDSDEFLMLELRGGDVAEEQIKPGWPAPSDVAERMFHWMTPYQRSFAQYPLVLHAGDLPAGTAAADSKLGAFVEEVLSCLPEFLPTHRDHPQWLYHWGRFVRARHEFLSGHLGTQTIGAPPESLFEVDKIWWQLDGARKRLAENRWRLERESRALNEAATELDKTSALELAAAARRYLEDAASPTLPALPGTNVFATEHVEKTEEPERATPKGKNEASDVASTALDPYREACAAIHDRHLRLRSAIHIESARLQEQIAALDGELAELPELEERYARVIKQQVRSAAVPIIRTQQGRRERNGGSASPLVRLARRIYGEWPRVRRISPFWSGLRHLVTIVDEAVARGAKDVLVIGDPSGIAASIADLPGRQVCVSLAELLTGNLAKAFAHPPQFDLCVCDLHLISLTDIGEIFADAWPFIREGGTLVGFCANFAGPATEIDSEALFDRLREFPGVRLQYSGSTESVAAVRAFDAARRGFDRRNPLGLVRAALALATSFIGVWRANRLEARNPKGASTNPGGCASITISTQRPLTVTKK